ncbi:GGDEF domain-containing protein [Rhodococcus sp. BP22]|uniref:GGDEF domain-containing protein n=1 Tax=Rhodococcus sp. BP22 TaxID=2758566 RepID=UPI0016497A08|nr:GGDEF domain-containing protein [Rhodococcus sp. BP22]
MSAFTRWWSQPADPTWTVAYRRSSPLLRHARFALGTWCWLYAVLCALMTFTPAGVPDGFGQVLAWGLAAIGVVLGALWMRGPWPTENYSRVFVAVIEIGIAAALLMLADSFVALPCAAGLAVNGTYIAVFHGPKMIVVHQAWAAVIVGVLFVCALAEPGGDVVVACAYLVLLILLLFSAPMFSYVLLLMLRRDASAALFDPLTGLHNRRGLAAAITEIGDRVGVVTVMVIDLDDFKAVNDRHGHAHGDAVLRAVANAIYAAFGPPAVTARTGGEEFAVVTSIDPAAAIAQADELQARLAPELDPGVTVSIGVAHTDASDLLATFDAVYARADTAMYAAKHAGGDTLYYPHECEYASDARKLTTEARSPEE